MDFMMIFTKSVFKISVLFEMNLPIHSNYRKYFLDKLHIQLFKIVIKDMKFLQLCCYIQFTTIRSHKSIFFNWSDPNRVVCNLRLVTPRRSVFSLGPTRFIFNNVNIVKITNVLIWYKLISNEDWSSSCRSNINDNSCDLLPIYGITKNYNNYCCCCNLYKTVFLIILNINWTIFRDRSFPQGESNSSLSHH